MPTGKKRKLTVNKGKENQIKQHDAIVDDLIEKTNKDFVETPEKIEAVEVEVGVDITKDGKPPIAVVFECEEERAIQTEWEYPNGTKGNCTFDAFPIMRDVVGQDIKASEGRGRSFSNAYCVPAKRILKCNAKKIYVIY